MIIGIGTDIVDARRIERMIEQYGEKFLNRIFTQTEKEYALSAKDEQRQLLRYANRFAAKEAVVKALENAKSISWQDIEIVKQPNGKPDIMLHRAAESAAALAAEGQYQLHLSLSDEFPYSQAYVILEKKPLKV